MNMKPRIVSTKLNASLPSLSLLAILLAACAPAATQTLPAAAPPVVEQPSATPLVDIPSPTFEAAPTEALLPTAIPVATSRGPDLEATDPTTVSLASGQYQFVEFFRFT